MKRTHNQSDDDVDDLPLKYISPDRKVQSIKELKRYSVHACEFCENNFKNRYDYLIHNAKHIIIPLIKMLPHYCAECDLYCISEEEMNEHMAVKHKTIVKPKLSQNDDCKTKITDRFKFEVEDLTEEPSEDDEPLTSLIKKEKEMAKDYKTENLLQNFVMNCKVDVEKFVPPWHSDGVKSNNVGVKEDTSKGENKPVARIKPSIERNHVTQNHDASLTNKLNIKTPTYDNVVKSEVDNFKSDIDPASDFSDLDDDPIVILAPVKKAKTESEHYSVHFDELMKPGIFFCKRCFKRFPTRFEVIVHEAVHLDLSKTYSKHSVHLASGTSKVKTCDRCYEEISDEKLHAKTCYRMHCSGCAKGFNNRTYLTAHEDKCNGEAVVNMCDSCLYFREKPKHIEYYGLMKCNNSNVKEICHWCGKLSEDVSLVTIISKKRLKDRIRFEGEEKDVPELSGSKKGKEEIKGQKNCSNERTGRGPKILSNRERLKLIQNRLKMMKK